MKRVYLIPAILLLVTLGLHAQQHTISGTWDLELPQTISLMESSTRQKFDNLDQSAKDRIEASMIGREFTFASDGTVTIHWQANGTPRTSSGTWEATGETFTLTIEGDVQQYTYELTAGSHLILRSTSPSGLFSNLYLTWHP